MSDPLKTSRKVVSALQLAKREAEAAIEAQKAAKLEEALAAKTPPMTTPQGTGLPLMPRSQGMYTPGIAQEDLPRIPMVDKARAAGEKPKYTERMQDLLDSPTARKKIDKLIAKGEELGMREWYGTEPLRQVAMDIGLTPKQFNDFMAQMASASQRNPVDQQNLMGSYLWHLSQTGQLPEDAYLLTNKLKKGERPAGTAIELPPGYGSLAQSDIFKRGKQIAAGDLEGALPPNAKLGTFYRNLLGNLKPVTVDVNAVRGPIIERGDPRWLTSKVVEKDPVTGKVTGEHFPRKAVESGQMSLKQAKERPGFWEAAPSGSEYAGFEDLWQRGAKRHNMAPAEAQALGWYGSADVTALKTKPELYIDNLERMIRRTAEITGKSPREVMEDMLRGKDYLKKKDGGEVTAEMRRGGGVRKRDMELRKDELRKKDTGRAVTDDDDSFADGGAAFQAPDNVPFHIEDRLNALGYTMQPEQQIPEVDAQDLDGTLDAINSYVGTAYASGGMAKAAKAVAKASEEASAAMPAVNRIDMNYKDVTKRVPELTEAARKVSSGEMSAAEYDALVNKHKPVTPYSFVPKPASVEDAMRALNESKREMFGKTGEMTPGEQADLRLDIPAYKDHGVWVNSIHRKGAPTVYGSTSAVKNATMIGSPDKAMKVATGETPKAPFAVIRGEWNPMDEATAVKNAQKYLKHKDWRQVGYDPERHGYFYDRATMEPILGAEEVIQIGPLVLAKKPRFGDKKEQKFDGGGLAVDQSDLGSEEPSKTRLMAQILARMAKAQGKEEIESLKKPRALTDLANRGIVASLAGLPVDLINMGLEGVDAARDLASGKRVGNRLASERPALGSEHLRDLMREYGMTTDEERPMMETALSLPSPAGALQAATKLPGALPKAARAGESALNTLAAAARRPMTPATITVEAVAPDLAKYKPRQWQETATRRLTGEGAPVSMETMGGRRTTKRPGQGVYENEAGQLETNPLVAVDVPRAGDLSKNKALRADIATAGQELGQEAMAAHRFVPMATNQIKDASAMLIKGNGPLTDEQVKLLGERLPGMIVAHNPRLGGVVIAPFDYQKGRIPDEFLDAQSVAKAVLGKDAKFQYGKAEQGRDLMYMPRSDYATEGAREPSAASKAMRERLKRAEQRLFRELEQSQAAPRQAREAQSTILD